VDIGAAESVASRRSYIAGHDLTGSLSWEQVFAMGSTNNDEDRTRAAIAIQMGIQRSILPHCVPVTRRRGSLERIAKRIGRRNHLNTDSWNEKRLFISCVLHINAENVGC